MDLIDNYSRYQKELKFHHIYPQVDGYCACGCGKSLTGKKKKWASEFCRDVAYYYFAILKGNSTFIRKELFKRDEGFCRNCGVYDKNWEADHIIPVSEGGGACGLDNYQTLCPDCHKEKTKNQTASHRRAISSHEAISALTLLT